MQQWRYRSIVIRDLSVAESKLNTEGEKGWELVAIFPSEGGAARVFFKAKAEDVPAPPGAEGSGH